MGRLSSVASLMHFDLVHHDILYNILLDRGLPVVVVRFLEFWYSRQQLCVCWNSSLSVPFSVSNGVRRGSIVPPFLFSVYVDCLLLELSKSGVGCYWGSVFDGAFCYAADIVLLAPCASALRIMLDICNSFATKRKLEFHVNKTQLICFHLPPKSATILLNNVVLQYSSKVTHLGHILTSTLDDSEDIARVLKDLIRKLGSMYISSCGSFCEDLFNQVLLPVSLHLVSGCKTNKTV